MILLKPESFCDNLYCCFPVIKRKFIKCFVVKHFCFERFLIYKTLVVIRVTQKKIYMNTQKKKTLDLIRNIMSGGFTLG